MCLIRLSKYLSILCLMLPLGCNAQTDASATTLASAANTASSDRGEAVYFDQSGLFRQLTDLKIPLRDGKWLAADVWLPKGGTRHPAILIMTPYNRKLVGAPLPDPEAELDLPDKSNYAYVLVDWRGFFGSRSAKKYLGGGMVQNGKDGYDVVEWIAEQSWSDGKVAMWGPSAVGRVQYAVAAERPPHLQAIAPMVAADFYSYDIFYYGGVLKKAYVDMLGTVGYGSQSKVRKNPINNRFWQAVKKNTSKTSRVNLPMLMTSGWYDLSVDTIIETFNNYLQRGTPRVKKNLRLWIGPWHHVAIGKRQQGELQFPEAEGVGAAVSRMFLDHNLRGIDNGWDRTPRACYLRMGVNQWLCSDSFPPEIKKTNLLYLAADNSLSARPPTTSKVSRSFEFDPADPSPTIGGMNAFISKDRNHKKVGMGPRDQGAVEKRRDNLVFTSAALDADLILEGKAELKLFLSSDRKDTDVAVRITDVYPDGRSMLVTDGIQRMCFRDGKSGNPPMKPGEIYNLRVKLSSTAYVFRKGHRLRLIVSSANYPRFDVNRNTGCDNLGNASRALIARNEVYFDRNRLSVLSLPQWKGVRPLPQNLRKQVGL